MLPYLKLKQDKGFDAAADEEVKRMKSTDDDAEFDPMEAAAQDLIDAVGKKDVKAVAEALRAAFELADSEPHAEGEHINEDQG